MSNVKYKSVHKKVIISQGMFSIVSFILPQIVFNSYQNIEELENSLIWSFDRKTLLDDKANAQKWIPVILGEKRTFHFEMHKNIWFPLKTVSILGTGDWRLSRETNEMCTFQVKCAHFTHFKLTERPLPRVVFLWL